MFLSYLFGVVSYNLMCVFSMYAIRRKMIIKKNQSNLFVIICCIVFCLIGILGVADTNDFFIYKDKIRFILSTKDSVGTFEPFWIYVIKNFRLTQPLYICILQVTSFFLFFWIVKLLNPHNLLIFISFWIILCFQNIIGGRAILFFMVYYLGIVCFAKRKILIALILLACSIFIHKTAYIAIPLFVISLLPLNKKFIMLMSFIVLIGTICIRMVVISNIGIIYNYFEEQGISGAGYLLLENNINSTGHWIWTANQYILRGIFFYFIFVTLKRLDERHYNSCSQFSIFYNMVFWGGLLSASLFLIDLPDSSIATRSLYIVVILPLPYLLGKLYDSQSKYARITFLGPILWIYLLIANLSLARVGVINHIL